MPIPPLAAAPAEAITHASGLIRAAHRPALLVGARGADQQSCTSLRALIGATELPVVETFQAAGVVPHALEDRYLGRVGLFRNQPGDLVVANADVLIAVGYDAVEYDPVLWNSDVQRAVVHIDSVPADVDNNYQPRLELRGDIAATLTALTDSLTGLRLTAEYQAEIAKQREALADIDTAARNTTPDGPLLDPVAVVLRLRAELDDDGRSPATSGRSTSTWHATSACTSRVGCCFPTGSKPWGSRCRGRWRPAWCGPAPTSCRSPAMVDSSSPPRNWRPRPGWV